MRHIPGLLKGLFMTVVLPALFGMAAVGPDDAVSNISKWATKLGIQNIPHWFAAPIADTWVVWASGALWIVSMLVWIFSRRKYADAVAAPVADKQIITRLGSGTTNKTIGVAEAYAYLKKDSQWRLDQNEPGTNSADLEVEFSAIHEIERAARDAEIVISGIKGGKGMHEEIPASYWRNAFIDPGPLYKSSPVAIAKPRPHMTGAPEFADLIVPQYQVLKTWPRADTKAQVSGLKLIYTVSELAELLKKDAAQVKEALSFEGVKMLHNGKEISAAKWQKSIKARMSRFGKNVVFSRSSTDTPQLHPDPSEVIVTAQSLPKSWQDQLRKL